jgi:hypothetical protein
MRKERTEFRERHDLGHETPQQDLLYHVTANLPERATNLMSGSAADLLRLGERWSRCRAAFP